MASERVRVEVWCEDLEHRDFANRLLEEVFGLKPRAIRTNTAPRGSGDAKAWVLSQYQRDVLRLCRVKRKQQRLGFLVIADGDNAGFRGRLRTFNPDARDPDDRIALLVPTWSIETWVLWLTDGAPRITESVSLKHRLPPTDFRTCLRKAVAAWRTPKPGEEQAVPSLDHARGELLRLPSKRSS